MLPRLVSVFCFPFERESRHGTLFETGDPHHDRRAQDDATDDLGNDPGLAK